MANVILLGLVSLLTDISTEMVYPLLPFYLTLRLGAGPAVLGLIEGLAESLASLLKVVFGRVSDKLGRRKGLAVAGYGSSTVGKVFLYFAGSWGGILVGRLADRFGKGVRTAPRDALVAESSPERRRGWAFGLHRTMDTFGATVGALLAYFLLLRLGTATASAEFRPIFLYSLVPAALGVAVLLWVRETAPAKRERVPRASVIAGHSAGADAPAASSASEGPGAPAGASGPQAVPARSTWAAFLALDPRLKLLLIVTGIFTLGNSSNQFLLLRAGETLGPAGAVLVYVLFNGMYAAFSWPAGWVSDKVGRERVLVTGFVLYAVVYGGFAAGLGSTVAGVVGLFALYGIYSALTDGVAKALVADLAPGDLRATVIGLHATIVGIGLFPASAIAGILWSALGPWAAFGFGALAGLAAAAGLAFFRWSRRAAGGR